ncbi:MAG TPA: glycogen synthase GlgA [Gammaproteobacteria bacterium]|nr:glycogen synthase GlgA [Gammaproteobacteria bacterium]
MRILFVTSEAHPLIKTGGLADVCGSLPRALAKLGHDVRLVLPAYPQARERAGAERTAATLTLPFTPEPVGLREGCLPDTSVPVYLVDYPLYFEREGNPYVTPDGVDWPDNALRFALFARAATALALDQAGLDWRPDVVHCHDWQSALTPALLSEEPHRPATVFTIHNLSYQGLFDWTTFQSLNLPYKWWAMDGLEFYGRMSFIKGALVFADWLTTVSPTYAREILTPEFGYGLEGLLAHRGEKLTGILNGVDYSMWDPRVDTFIRRHYSPGDMKGKAVNKAALQERFGLQAQPDVPLFAHVGRLVEQKGADLLLAVLPELIKRRMQLVVLGSGDKALEDALRAAQGSHPQNLGVVIGYDEALAHQVEAGADAFVMPSRFEPCGLNQIYSLRYGTVPIVRRTGGLADTVIDADALALQQGRATGIVFDHPHPKALLAAVDRALILYDQPDTWQALRAQGMDCDYSWTRSAERYLALYARAGRKRPGAA